MHCVQKQNFCQPITNPSTNVWDLYSVDPHITAYPWQGVLPQCLDSVQTRRADAQPGMYI